MSEELAVFQEAQRKMEVAKKKQDASLLQQIIEPLAEAIEELSSTMQDMMKEAKKEKPETIAPDYFDKDLSKSVVSSIDKVIALIKNFKQSEIKIDLSPINSIAAEIKKGNDNIIELLNKPNQSEDLYKMISVVVGKQNSFLEQFKQPDISNQLTAISQSIEKGQSNKQWEFQIIRREGGSIDKVIAKSK